VLNESLGGLVKEIKVDLSENTFTFVFILHLHVNTNCSLHKHISAQTATISVPSCFVRKDFCHCQYSHSHNYLTTELYTVNISETVCELDSVDCGQGQWQALVSIVLNLWVLQRKCIKWAHNWKGGVSIYMFLHVPSSKYLGYFNYIFLLELYTRVVVSKVECLHPRGYAWFSIGVQVENKPRRPSRYKIYI
jgi:hypothetical protein